MRAQQAPGQLAGATSMVKIADWNGDRRSDVLVRTADDGLWIYASTANGDLAAWKQIGRNWGQMDLVTFAGRLSGTGQRYVLARHKTTHELHRYEMLPNGRLTGDTVIGRGWNAIGQLVSVGDFSGDGRDDVLGIRVDDGSMWLYGGTATGALRQSRQVGRGWSGMKVAFSPGDLNKDLRRDLVGISPDGAMVLYLNVGGKWGPGQVLATGFAGDRLFA